VSLSQCCSCASCVPGRVAGLLLPHLSGTVAEGAGEAAGRVLLRVRPAAAQAACPGCGTHVPAGGRDVVIVLAARRFRCVDPACPKVTFTEQWPERVKAKPIILNGCFLASPTAPRSTPAAGARFGAAWSYSTPLS
jgi:hypothetical protein